jgi:hypothetical protein
LTFFPNPVPSLTGVWQAEKCADRQPAMHISNGESGAQDAGNQSQSSLFPKGKQLYLERK